MPVNVIKREDVEALISEQVQKSIEQDAPKASVFMALGRKLPNMTSNQTRIKVLDVMPTAYWVEGDTGMKQTSDSAWDNVYLHAEELAVIVPIPEAVLDDADYDIIGEVKPRIIEAIGKKVDEAVIFGINKPVNWPADIITRARQAGNNVAVPGEGQDYYDVIMGENGVLAKVEEFGYPINGAIASLSMKSKLRGLRTTDGQPIFTQTMQGATPYAIDGQRLFFPENGSFRKDVAQLVVGDWKQAVYAIRQDITTKILTEAVIQDPATGAIVYNLAQQDMIALRVVFRMGWAMPNPVTRLDENRVSCPFAYLEPATAATTYTATFTVTDADAAGIENVIVDIGGSRILTDGDGEAVFNLRNGKYNYTVSKRGLGKTTGTVTINGQNATVAVTLV